MRKLIIILIYTFLCTGMCIAEDIITPQDSVSKKKELTVLERDSILESINMNVASLAKFQVIPQAFKLYKTENIYTFLKLNTATGQISQVQWSLEDSKEFETKLSDRNLFWGNEEPGVFELYPTTNMYQFILLNTRSGACWHVQWSHKPEQRFVQRIY